MLTRQGSFCRGRAFAVALASVFVLAVSAPEAMATDVGALQSQLSSARQQAGALAGQLAGEQSQLLAARQQAAVAAAREQQLGSLLAVGQQRAAALGQKVDSATRQLAIERARLARARAVLSRRLVQIYMNGTPNVTEVLLSAHGFDDLITRVDYLRMIEDSDQSLANRVEGVRNEVSAQLALVSQLKAQADAYNAQLASARSQASAVRQRAQSAATQLASVAAARQATLNTLRSNISGWMGQIQAAQNVSAQQAQQQVGQWLGGPYSIPSYIVNCESGGNYRAVNPSSGAGGAYQIMPSTWAAYGGQGLPQNASPSQQNQIAAKIWAGSGPGAWACAGG